MKLLTIAATSSTRSVNRQLLGYAAGLVDGADVRSIDLNDHEMPIYSQDREADGGIPQAAHDFFAAIGDADAVMIAFAEHNGSYTAAFKNILDWTSRIDTAIFQGKPTVMLATSPGPGGGRRVLDFSVAAASTFGSDLRGQLAMPSFYEHFDVEAGRVSDPELDAQLRQAVAALTEPPSKVAASATAAA